MVQTHSKGKIVFVSSLLGYFGMIGYSTYSPGKHAIRGEFFRGSSMPFHIDENLSIGLAETLRQELLLYSIDVHLYMPGTMYSPGYEEENKTKPELVRKIEESDEGLTPESAAKGLYQGAVPQILVFKVVRLSARMQVCGEANFTLLTHSSPIYFERAPAERRRTGRTFSRTCCSVLLAQYVPRESLQTRPLTR